MTSFPTAAGTPPASDDFDALLVLMRHLSTITTLPTLREALLGPLQALLPSPDISILRAAHGAWEPIIGPDDGPDRIHTYSWTLLVADGKTVGMLGFGPPPDGSPAGRLADGITSLLAIVIQNIIELDNVKHDSVRDGLTGCYNRAHAMEVLEGNLRRANRTGLPVSIVMMDLDDFKRINDGYGHVPGDAVLAAVAARLHGMPRQSDVRCRLGGDEFLVILPDTPLEDAARVAESIRQGIEDLEIASVRGKLTITASIGVAASDGKTIDVAGLVDRADLALYRAKEAGRNCVRTGTPAPSQVQEDSGLPLATG